MGVMHRRGRQLGRDRELVGAAEDHADRVVEQREAAEDYAGRQEYLGLAAAQPVEPVRQVHLELRPEYPVEVVLEGRVPGEGRCR